MIDEVLIGGEGLEEHEVVGTDEAALVRREEVASEVVVASVDLVDAVALVTDVVVAVTEEVV